MEQHEEDQERYRRREQHQEEHLRRYPVPEERRASVGRVPFPVALEFVAVGLVVVEVVLEFDEGRHFEGRGFGGTVTFSVCTVK